LAAGPVACWNAYIDCFCCSDCPAQTPNSSCTVRWKTTAWAIAAATSTAETHHGITRARATATPAVDSTCSSRAPVAICIPMPASHWRSHSCRIRDIRSGSSSDDWSGSAPVTRLMRSSMSFSRAEPFASAKAVWGVRTTWASATVDKKPSSRTVNEPTSEPLTAAGSRPTAWPSRSGWTTASVAATSATPIEAAVSHGASRKA
jgi:hypothetical protein